MESVKCKRCYAGTGQVVNINITKGKPARHFTIPPEPAFRFGTTRSSRYHSLGIHQPDRYRHVIYHSRDNVFTASESSGSVVYTHLAPRVVILGLWGCSAMETHFMPHWPWAHVASRGKRCSAWCNKNETILHYLCCSSVSWSCLWFYLKSLISQ